MDMFFGVLQMQCIFLRNNKIDLLVFLHQAYFDDKDWKLIINAPVISCEFVFSKKDLPTFAELKTFLTADGYQVL